MATSRRVLICGDVNGNLKKLYEDVAKLQEKHGNFDFLLCCGKFLPGDKDPEFLSYIGGKKPIPIMTYFVDSESMTFCTHCGSESLPLGSSKKLFFLGTHGVQDIQGVRVAYLSGRMPERREDYHSGFKKDGQPAFQSNFYNAGVIETLKGQKGVGIDILVTSEWPANVMEGTDLTPQIAFSSTAVAEVADALEPRFHACALANRFLRRQPYLSSKNKFVCRLIGLGIFDKRPDIQPQKSIHALIVCPFEKAKNTLFKDAEKSTPCPFTNVSTPIADRWQTRKGGDIVVRSSNGQNWTVHSETLCKASTSFAQRVKSEKGSGIIMKEVAEVVEPFLQYLYRSSIDETLSVPILLRLLILADKEEIEQLAEECNRLIGENKDFPQVSEIVEIIKLLKHNKSLQYCKRWYTRVIDMIKSDEALLRAIVDEL